MRKLVIPFAALAAAALVSPALAAPYPVSGKWGESKNAEKGAIDCGKLRVIGFDGEQRTDSTGGVRAFRNKSVTPDGPSRYRIVDVFTTGQIRNGNVSYTLRQIDADRIELNMQPGGMVKLQRCK